MKIEIDKTTFCVTGDFKKFQNTRTVGAKIEAAGGKVMKSMGQKVQVLVYGSGYTRKTETANDRGLPIIREADLDALLEQGWVEIDFETPTMEGGSSSVDELLGEVRSVIAKPASRRLWRELVGLIDQCDVEQVGPLVDYIEDHLDRWPEELQLHRAPTRDWIASMSRGEDSPAYRLIKRLDLGEVDLNSTGFKKILSCKSISNATLLDIAVDKKLTKTAFRALSQSEHFASLEQLTLGYFDEACARELDTGGQLTNLTSIGCYPSDYWRVDDEWYKVLFETDACSRVERLVFYRRNGWSSGVADVFEQVGHDGALPAFSHLEFDFVRFGLSMTNPLTADTITWALERASEAARARVKTLTIRANVRGFYSKDGHISLHMLPNLEELRIFDAGDLRSPRATQEDFDRVLHVDKMRFPESLLRVVTNSALDRGAFARLIASKPNLEITQDLSISEAAFEAAT